MDGVGKGYIEYMETRVWKMKDVLGVLGFL